MAKPIPEYVQRRIKREMREDIDNQLAALGVPAGHLLLQRVEMLDGLTVEYRIVGRSYPHREALKTAGFKWDSRGFWLRHSPARRSALREVPIVGDEDCWVAENGKAGGVPPQSA